MSEQQRDPGTGKMLAKYSEKQIRDAIDDYSLYGGKAAARMHGIESVGYLKQLANNAGVAIDKKALEARRKKLSEATRHSARNRMLSLIDDTLERMQSEYRVPIKLEGYATGEYLVYDRPPPKDMEALAKTVELLVKVFRTEMGEPLAPVVKIEQQQPTSAVVINLNGVADPDARARAVKKLTSTDVIEGEVVDEATVPLEP